jgi:hypothetical protein
MDAQEKKKSVLDYVQPRFEALKLEGYNIRITHRRCYAKLVNGQVQYVLRAKYETADVDLSNLLCKGGSTTLELFDPKDNFVAAATANCSRNDAFCRYVGIGCALTKLIKELRSVKSPIMDIINHCEERSEVFEETVKLGLADELEQACKNVPIEDMPKLVSIIQEANPGMGKEEACKYLFLQLNNLLDVVARAAAASVAAAGGTASIGVGLDVVKGPANVS